MPAQLMGSAGQQPFSVTATQRAEIDRDNILTTLRGDHERYVPAVGRDQPVSPLGAGLAVPARPLGRIDVRDAGGADLGEHLRLKSGLLLCWRQRVGVGHERLGLGILDTILVWHTFGIYSPEPAAQCTKKRRSPFLGNRRREQSVEFR